MKRANLIIIAMASCLTAGCAESTAPPPFGIHVEPLVPLRMIGVQGGRVAELPAVRLVDAGNGSPIPGKEFVFTLESPLGEKIVIPVMTDIDGVARLSSWTLGQGLGLYRATAVTDGWGSVRFAVFVPGAIEAIYDLKTINGNSLPTVQPEETLVLYESGFVNRFFRVPDRKFTPEQQHLGTYRRSGSGQINFELECGTTFLQRCAPSGLLAIVRGAELVIDKSEAGDGPWIEVYALRPRAEGAP